jgi:hypothetical protein
MGQIRSSTRFYNARHEARNVTPEHMQCLVGACPAIYETKQGNYLVVGKQVNPSDVGLAGKVGEGEVLVKVPRELIDAKQD